MKQLQSKATLKRSSGSAALTGMDSGAIQQNRARGPGLLTAAIVFVAVGCAGVLVYSVLTEGAGSGEAGLRVGATFQNEDELLAVMPGYVIMGRFHVHWPARVTRITEGADGVELQVGSTPHNYEGFPGRQFRAVNFKSSKSDMMAIVLATRP